MSKHSESDSAGARKYGHSNNASGTAHGAEALIALDSVALADVVNAVVGVGDSIQFGVTRDGGAVVITLYSEGGIDKVYASTTEELQDKFQEIEAAATT
jgi:hypothetical protein